jgi:nucleoside-triphosphatase THEP1
MPRLTSPAPIIAIIYDEGERITPLMDRIVAHLRAKECRLAGLRQREERRPGQSRCDMILEELASGIVTPISEDRGAGARGCRLDVDALLNAMVGARVALDDEPDLLLVNKFGKTESEGGGLRPLIVAAIERDVPVLVAVPRGNIDGWRAFAGELAVEHRLAGLPDDDAALIGRLGFEIDGWSNERRPHSGAYWVAGA